MSPIGLRDNIFIMNRAAYGNDYASYPFKLAFIMPTDPATHSKTTTPSSSKQILLSETGIQNLISGEKLPERIRLGIYDQDNQLVKIL
jgi:hypothetical protein